jgi:hypothetical protein
MTTIVTSRTTPYAAGIPFFCAVAEWGDFLPKRRSRKAKPIKTATIPTPITYRLGRRPVAPPFGGNDLISQNAIARSQGWSAQLAIWLFQESSMPDDSHREPVMCYRLCPWIRQLSFLVSITCYSSEITQTSPA